jgi:hypothetical protein
MPVNLPNTDQQSPLRSLESVQRQPAKASLRTSESTGQQLRRAIRQAGYTISEASGICGVKDEAQFRRMLDGKEHFDVHRLCLPEAADIWREFVVVRARQSGYAVERVIRWTETA